MEETQAKPSYILDDESKIAKPTEIAVLDHQPACSWLKQYIWWVEVAIYTLFVVFGSSIATLLGRLYYTEGGTSKWMGSLVQTAGFPVLLPLFCISSNIFRNPTPASESRKVIKENGFRIVLKLTFFEGLVATSVILIGLFASTEWTDLGRESKNYRLGNVSYVMTLLWTTISWQVFSIGCIGIIFKVSALFSNVIGMLGLHVAPVAAVVIFHDKMDGVKVMFMALVAWGFASYIYQHYLDDKMKINIEEKKKVSNDISLAERG